MTNPAPASPADKSNSAAPGPILRTRFTERFGLTTPVALAPMALASGGALTAACANAGALGLLGGAYGDLAWTQREHRLALQGATEPGRPRMGVGFITWKLDESASALDWVLDLPMDERPRTIMLSFGDPSPYARRIQQAGCALICQIQRLEQLPRVLGAGADVVAAQGGEAGGHGMDAMHGRATFTLVPELADALAAQSPQTLLLAAGGVADGRGLAAALMLGADGVLVGSRLWAAQESLAAKGAVDMALATNGDGTARTGIFDILRRKNWPAPYDFRAIRNALHRSLEGDVAGLRAQPEEARAAYDAGVAAGDFSRAHATVGEGVGLIKDVAPAAELVERMTRQAQALLSGRVGR